MYLKTEMSVGVHDQVDVAVAHHLLGDGGGDDVANDQGDYSGITQDHQN